mgnify:CR=1 FL=1
MYDKALARREQMTYTAVSLEEMKKTADEKPGFIKPCGAATRPARKSSRRKQGSPPLYAL